MIRLFLMLIVLSSLPIDTPNVTGTFTPGTERIYPNTPRQITFTLHTHQPLWALVVQIHIRGAVSADPNDDGACTGMGRDERGGTQETVCTWIDVPADTVITRTVTFNPAHIVTNPISRACGTPMTIGFPVSLAANGETLIYRTTVWAEYQPGYCVYMPL